MDTTAPLMPEIDFGYDEVVNLHDLSEDLRDNRDLITFGLLPRHASGAAGIRGGAACRARAISEILFKELNKEDIRTAVAQFAPAGTGNALNNRRYDEIRLRSQNR